MSKSKIAIGIVILLIIAGLLTSYVYKIYIQPQTMDDHWILSAHQPVTDGTHSVLLQSPNGGEFFNTDNKIHLHADILGLTEENKNAYRLIYLLIPLESEFSSSPITLGSEMYHRDTIPLQSTITTDVIAPPGNWRTSKQKATTTDSLYKLVLVLGMYDETVCNQKDLSTVLGINKAEATSPRLCNPYRVVAYDVSDAPFTIRQPYVTLKSINHPETESVTATATVVTPDSCHPYRVHWWDQSVKSSEQIDTVYTPSTNCVSTTSSQTYTYTFKYQHWNEKSAPDSVVGEVQIYYSNNASFVFDTADKIDVPVISE